MYKLNLIRSPADKRDYTIKIESKTPLRGVVDNSANCTSVKDQGAIGSCTAFAAVALAEYNRKKYYRSLSDAKANLDDVFSEKFTYYVTRVEMMKWPANEDNGAYVKDAVASIVQLGTCLESFCPYDADYINKPSPLAYTQARGYQAISYAKIDDTTDRAKTLLECKTLLNEGFCMVAGFVCFDNIWSAVEGKIPLPSGSIIGAHAILICGYNDETKCFKFKNSWGPNWGKNGYGQLPYEYLDQGYLWDIWTITQQENDNIIIGVRKPKLEDALNQLLAKNVTVRQKSNQATERVKVEIAQLNKTVEDVKKMLNNTLKLVSTQPMLRASLVGLTPFLVSMTACVSRLNVLANTIKTETDKLVDS